MAQNIANQEAETVPPRQLTAKEAEENMKELLIELVKARQFIYDKGHPLHYCTNAKVEVWDEISKILTMLGVYLFLLFLLLYHMNWNGLLNVKIVQNVSFTCSHGMHEKVEELGRSIEKKIWQVWQWGVTCIRQGPNVAVLWQNELLNGIYCQQKVRTVPF